MAKKKYKLVEPDFVKDLKDPNDVIEHNEAFINAVNEIAEKKYAFLGLVYNENYNYGAKLCFVKDDKPHTYKIVNKFVEEDGFRFCIDLGSLYGRVYLYEMEAVKNAGSK